MIECDRPGALLDGPSVQGAIGVSIAREWVDQLELAATLFEDRHPNMLGSGRFARDNNQPVRIGDPMRPFRINDLLRRSRPGAG